MSDSAILTTGLSRSFGGAQAVASVDLDVKRGEMFGLVGPDGAGKTTTIRLLCGVLRPTSGAGRILGFDLLGESERIKARIGYLSQSFTLYGDLTVDENIEFFGELHGVRGLRARRDELLAFTRLTPFRNRLAQALSGGMKKKLALACTLIHTPDLIFLDEPSTGVDPISRGEFWSILSNLLEQRVTIFMTTPYLDEAERCHRIGLIHRGRIVRTGTPDELKRDIRGAVYRLDCPRPKEARQYIRREWPALETVLYGDHLSLMAAEGGDLDRTLAARLDGQGLGPATLVRAAPSLEDVFITLMSAERQEGVTP